MKGSFLESTKARFSPNLPFTFGPPFHDAIIVSDLHLGSSLCQDKPLIEFLEKLECSEIQTQRLILNGDVFDSIDFRRLKKRHWKVLSLVRKLSDKISITWVCGNHDGPADPISHLLGVQVRDEYLFKSNGHSVLVLHGHQFDDFISMYPTITFVADLVYRMLQWIDRTHRVARFAKSNTKVFLRCIEKIRTESVAYARSKNVDIVCCGHTHHAEHTRAGTISYLNSGCWTEYPPTYVTVHNGVAQLNTFETALEEEPRELPDLSNKGDMVTPPEFVLS